MEDLVVLDLDGVIIKGQSQKMLLKYLLKNKIITFWSYLKIIFWFFLYKINIFSDPQPVLKYALTFLKNKNVEDVEKIINIYFEKTLKKYIFKEIFEIIEEHKRIGRNILIISNSIDLIVKKIAAFLILEIL